MNLRRAFLVWSATTAVTTTALVTSSSSSSSSAVPAFAASPSSPAATSLTGPFRRPAFSTSSLCMVASDSLEKPAVERLPDSAVEIKIPVPGSATQAAYDKVCRELSKQVQIPGFRKGSRIPPQVLEQSMAAKGGRNALKVQAISELLEQLLEPALKEESLDPIGKPTLQVAAEELAESYKPGEPLTLPVRCDVWPEITWKDAGNEENKPYLGLTGKYSRKPFDEEKMNKALDDLRERYATLEPISDSAHELQMGDACTVNMAGFMANADGSKGDPLPNAASGDRVEVVLGKGRYMEGLVEGLLNGKVGETKVVHVSFPEKLRDKTLAGKRAVFDVEILEASERTIPEVTDEFAAKVRPGLTADALMKELRKAIDEEDSKEFIPARNKALAESLARVMDVEIPDTLVTNQAREKFAVMMAEMRDNGVSDEEIKGQINPENFNKYKEIVRDDIVRDFRVSIATDEIARMEGIEVEDYKVEEQMQAIKKDAGASEDFDENMIRGKVEATLLRQEVMNWLAERSNLEVVYEKEQEFDEQLMQKLADEALEREKKLAEERGAKVEEAAMEPEPVAVAEKEVVDEAPPAAVEVEKTEEPEPAPVAEAVEVEEKKAEPAPATAAVEVEEKKEEPKPAPVEEAAEEKEEPAPATAAVEVEEKKVESKPAPVEEAAAEEKKVEPAAEAEKEAVTKKEADEEPIQKAFSFMKNFGFMNNKK